MGKTKKKTIRLTKSWGDRNWFIEVEGCGSRKSMGGGSRLVKANGGTF